MSFTLDDLYFPDGKTLTTFCVGRPGSGKSYFLKNTILQAMKDNKNKDWRIIYICPKSEMSLGDKNLVGTYDMVKHLKKNRVAVIYPNIDYLDEEVDYIIDTLFDIKTSNPNFKATLVIDDAQIFINNRKGQSKSLRRLALTGRSKMIKPVLVSHSFIFSRDLEGSTSTILNFTLPVKMLAADAHKRYGFDAEEYMVELSETPYSYVYFDVVSGKSKLMPPLEVKR
tara:strand:+ start:224 stop:901 length:678 start_codon:yes stop_codon:yes gene_type:complete